MVRLGFHAGGLQDPRIRGFNRYQLELLRAFSRLTNAPAITLFSPQPPAREHALIAGALPWVRGSLKPYLAWEQLQLPRQLRENKIDVFHASANFGISRWRGGHEAKVITLHDILMHEQTLEQGLFRSVKRFKSDLRYSVSWQAAKSADAVITVSEYSKRQILRYFPHWENKIHVVYNGVSPLFSPGPAPSLPERPQFSYAGGFENRKNVELIAQALGLFSSQDLAAFQVTLVGDPGSISPGLRAKFQRFPNVSWTGYVSDERLTEIYRSSRATLFPSLAEGFGLPVLESLACGTPVLCSEATSLKEVGGDCCAYFDPQDAKKLHSLMHQALHQADWKVKRSQACTDWAGTFTWERTAAQTLDVYREVMAARA